MQNNTVFETKKDYKKLVPKMYKVILLNDNYTTFEFVIEILKIIYKKNEEEAIYLTQKIDREGSGIAGIYPYEIAKSKVSQTHKLAGEYNFPLKAIIEEEN